MTTITRTSVCSKDDNYLDECMFKWRQLPGRLLCSNDDNYQDECRGKAPATTGMTMSVPLFEKCRPSGTCKTVIKQSGSIDICASGFDLFCRLVLVDLPCICSRTEYCTRLDWILHSHESADQCSRISQNAGFCAFFTTISHTTPYTRFTIACTPRVHENQSWQFLTFL